MPSVGLLHTGGALLVHQLWHEASKVVVTWLPQKHPPHGPPRTPHHSKSITMTPHDLGRSLPEYVPGNVEAHRQYARVIGIISWSDEKKVGKTLALRPAQTQIFQTILTRTRHSNRQVWWTTSTASTRSDPTMHSKPRHPPFRWMQKKGEGVKNRSRNHSSTRFSTKQS